MKQEKIEAAITECYVELFKNSTPSGDFHKLVENATINDRGQKEIPFMDYEIEAEKHEAIVETVIKKYRVPTYLRQRFRTTIMLGCSPKFKDNERITKT